MHFAEEISERFFLLACVIFVSHFFFCCAAHNCTHTTQKKCLFLDFLQFWAIGVWLCARKTLTNGPIFYFKQNLQKKKTILVCHFWLFQILPSLVWKHLGRDNFQRQSSEFQLTHSSSCRRLRTPMRLVWCAEHNQNVPGILMEH